MQLSFSSSVIPVAIGVATAGISIHANAATDNLDDKFRFRDQFRISRTPSLTQERSNPSLTSGPQTYSCFAAKLSLAADESKWSFDLAATPQAGFDSNPLNNTDATGVSFWGFDLKDDLVYASSDQLKFKLAHDLQSRFFETHHFATGENTSDANSLANKVSLGAAYDLKHWTLGLSALGSHLVADGQAFSESAGARPSVSYDWGTAGFSTEASYQYGRFFDLTHPAAPARADNANDHTPRIEADWDFSKAPVAVMSKVGLQSIALGYAHKWHDSAATERTYGDHGIDLEFVGNYPGNDSLGYDLSYTHHLRDFSGADTAAVGIRRSDSSDEVNLVLSWQFYNTKKADGWRPLTTTLIVSYDFQTNSSNKTTSEYDEHIISIGLKVGL